MENPKVSVVLPVYRVHDYIERCIECLRRQTLSDIEMIFVDDCGNDGSMDIVAAYAEQDERILMLSNSQNSGAGPSRNAGIEAARGEYLAFIDPDDFCGDDFLELLYSRAVSEHADIVKGTRSLVHGEGVEAVIEDQDSLNRVIEKGLHEGIPLYRLFTFQHTTALYRRELLMQSGARYGTSRNGQDTTFLLKVCHAAQSLYIEHDARYFYIQREGSAVHTFTKRRLDAEVDALTQKIDYLLEAGLTDEDGLLYAEARMRNALAFHANLLYLNTLPDELDSLLDAFREQALRLPDPQALAALSLDMRALVEDGVNLCTASADKGTADFADVRLDALERWVDFVREDPEGREDYLPGVMERARRVLFVQAAMVRDGEGGAEALLVSARAEALRLPDPQALAALSLDMRAMVEDGVNLCTAQMATDGVVSGVAEMAGVRLDALERWVDFVREDPEGREDYLPGVMERARRVLFVQAAMVRDGEGGAEALLASVRAEALRLPDPAVLAALSLDMRALVEDGVNLCTALAAGDKGTADIADVRLDALERWVDFVREDPEGRKDYLPGVEVRAYRVLLSYRSLRKQGDSDAATRLFDDARSTLLALPGLPEDPKSYPAICKFVGQRAKEGPESHAEDESPQPKSQHKQSLIRRLVRRARRWRSS